MKISGSRLGACLLYLMIWGCSDDDPTLNVAPTVEITFDPISGDTVSYAIDLSWSGTDRDGSIARFEIAVDPEASFTEEEIAQGGPNIVSEFRPGKNGSPDTTRVTKNGLEHFDWIHTLETSKEFVFSTPFAESVMAQPTGRFFGMHAVYVRAVDDDQAASLPAKIAFTAETIAPVSRIVRPAIAQEILDLGPSITVEWTGADEDGASQKLGYEMKLLRLDTLSPSVPILQASPGLLLWDPTPWSPLEDDGGPLTLPLEVPGWYLLGIRAVDAASAVEPFLELGRNVVKLQAFDTGGTPLITLRTASGTFQFRGAGTQDGELVTGMDLHVRVECSAEDYGESCDAWRWGLDLADRDAPDGWSEWTAQPGLPPLRFPKAGIHVFYLDARDRAGGTTRATLILHVLEAPFDREVLLVDDSFDNLVPRDSQNDAFWNGLASYYADHSDLTLDQFFTYDVHGADDRGNLMPSAPLLADLLRYKLLVWYHNGSGYNGDSALLRSTLLSPRLFIYLNAGGKIWLTSNGMATLLSPCPPPMVCADTDAADTRGFSFCRYFGLCIDFVSSSSEAEDALVLALPYPGIDLPTLTRNPKAGAVRTETVFDPISTDDIPGFVGDIDSVLAHGAAGPRLDPPVSSTYEGKPVAVRWHDPDPDPIHGRTAWFGFSLYYFDVDAARETFRRTLDWFREEEP